MHRQTAHSKPLFTSGDVENYALRVQPSNVSICNYGQPRASAPKHANCERQNRSYAFSRATVRNYKVKNHAVAHKNAYFLRRRSRTAFLSVLARACPKLQFEKPDSCMQTCIFLPLQSQTALLGAIACMCPQSQFKNQAVAHKNAYVLPCRSQATIYIQPSELAKYSFDNCAPSTSWARARQCALQKNVTDPPG